MMIPVISAFIQLGAGPVHLYTAAKVRQEAIIKAEEQEHGAQKIMIRGVISAIGTNAFTIGEHAIYIDAAKTGSFRQMGTIETGARAEVKARRVGEVLYAEQVVIIGTGQGKTQIVYTTNRQQEKPPRASVNTDTRTALWVKAKGSLEQLALYLKNVLKLFTSASV